MKRSTNRIALPSCWEQLRAGKAWRRLCLALLVAVMTLTTQTAWAQTSGQQQTGGESQPYNPEQQEEVEVTLEIVNKLLDDYYKTGTDASNTSLDNIAYIVYQNIPEGEGALKDLAQTTQENVSLAGGKLNELKGGLEANNTAVSSANTITGNLDAVNELVEVNPNEVDSQDPKIFEFLNSDGSKTKVGCINEFGDRAATFDAQMKQADQALQNAQNTQNATSNTEAVNYATEAKNYLNNANSALTSASSLITSAETVISTARTDLTDANSAFTGVSKTDLDNMQTSLSNAKDCALNAKNSAATLKTNSTNNTNIDADIKNYIEITASKTADLYNEIKPLKVSSAPGGAALTAVNQKITGLEGNVSWAKQCLAIMQERYNTLNTALTALGLLPVEPDPVSYIDENGTRQNCTDYTVLDGNEIMLAGGWYVVNSNVTVDGRINLTGDMNLILGDGYTLDVKGIYIPLGSTLTIYAQSDGMTAGKIVSKPTSGAGIGGMSGDDNGNIVICGGIIEATGGKDAAAIGGGDGGDGGTITINGGTITANGPTDSETCENGAGIGGGDGGNGGTITINGGTITTYSRDGAGIGGGDEGDGGTITINGGTITSVKVNQGQGARIGGGCVGAPGTIIITGGTITTDGGTGAGIGGGKRNLANGTVTINGGVIDASGSYGIGAGEGGANVAITLGWTNASDRITASSYNGTVTIVDGKAFTDLTNTYLGTLTAAEKTTIANVELQPLAGVTLTKDGSGSLTASFSGTTEDEVSIPVNVTVDNVTIDRTFEYDKACTLYLPFGIAASKVLGGKFHTFTSVDETKDPWEVKYTEVTGDIAANTPYIFLPNDKNGGKITVNNGTDKITVSTSNPHTTQDAGNNWKFIGTYERIKWTHDTTDPEYDDIREGEIGSIYGFAANNSGTDHVGDFVKVGNNVWINPMRAYLKRSTSLARAMTPGTQTQQLPDKMKVVIVSANGTTTEIGTLDIRTGEISLDEWYGLDGRRLSGKPTTKGVYINNGKKVVIK